jgi:hypothetical protein
MRVMEAELVPRFRARFNEQYLPRHLPVSLGTCMMELSFIRIARGCDSPSQS